MISIKNLWDKLPKEVKVAGFIIASYLISLLIPTLQNLSLDNRIVMGVVNLLIVFLLQIKPRVDAYRSSKK